MSRDLVEQLAEQVHAAWMDSKRQRGVASRQSESGEELMVPYAQLSEEAKELDRVTVRSALQALDTLGYSVVAPA
jgi:hypothetical protein